MEAFGMELSQMQKIIINKKILKFAVLQLTPENQPAQHMVKMMT